MTADTAPLWVRIVIACVPVLAALVAGIFLLTATLSRRTERLKNLVEIRKNLPECLDPHKALQRMILRELEAIDHVTTERLRWSGFVKLSFVALLVGLYMYVALYSFEFVSRPLLGRWLPV